MLYPSINKLLGDSDNRYSLVIAVAKRARKIAEDAQEENETLPEKPVKIAINEIADHKIKIVQRDSDEYLSEETTEGDPVIADDGSETVLSDAADDVIPDGETTGQEE